MLSSVPVGLFPYKFTDCKSQVTPCPHPPHPQLITGALKLNPPTVLIATTNTSLAQKFGLLAIGESVCREFGADGIFHGVVTAYQKSGSGGLYTVEYCDGDVEDMDLEEYTFAYAFFVAKRGGLGR